MSLRQESLCDPQDHSLGDTLSRCPELSLRKLLLVAYFTETMALMFDLWDRSYVPGGDMMSVCSVTAVPSVCWAYSRCLLDTFE